MKFATACILSWITLSAVPPHASGPPQILARDIVNAASLAPGPVAAGEIIVLFPSGAGPETFVGLEVGSDSKLTTMAGGTRVLFDGIAAPMLYARKNEIAAVVPYEVQGKTTTQLIVEYQGVKSAPVTLRTTQAVPALFTRGLTGKGQASMLNQTGCCNSEINPAARGSIGVLYATGSGQTDPPSGNGYVFTTARKIADYPVPRQPVQVTVGGVPAEVLYAGAAPHLVAGWLQVNFRVPMNAPTGDAIPLVLTVAGVSSPGNVTMAVRSAQQRVLVIESDDTVRNWYSQTLSREGFEVWTARNDSEALARVAGQSVDMVISDIAMPSGQARAQTLRAIQATGPQLRVAATVPALTPEALRAADLVGAQTTFARPLSTASVPARVRQLLRPEVVTYVQSAGGKEGFAFPSLRKIMR